MMRRCSLAPSGCGREKWSSAMDLCLPTYFRNDGYLRNGSLLVTLRMEVQSTNHIWKVTTLKSRTTGLCKRNAT